jgi:hypothetical protein
VSSFENTVEIITVVLYKYFMEARGEFSWRNFDSPIKSNNIFDIPLIFARKCAGVSN